MNIDFRASSETVTDRVVQMKIYRKVTLKAWVKPWMIWAVLYATLFPIELTKLLMMTPRWAVWEVKRRFDCYTFTAKEKHDHRDTNC